MRSKSPIRWVCVLAGVAVLAVSARASAQVPPVPAPPALPSVPAPVEDAITQAETTVIPIANQAVVQLGPTTVPVGFALRPGCAELGSTFVLMAILGIALPLPVSPVGVASPGLILCSYSFEGGPADPVFQQVDGAVGPQLSGAMATAVASGGNGVDTVRGQVGAGCIAAVFLEPAPANLPPPGNRLDPFLVLCH